MPKTIVKDYVDYVLVGTSVLIETREGELFRTHVIRRCYFDTKMFDSHFADYGSDWEHRIGIDNPEPGIYFIHDLVDPNVKAYAIFDNRI